MTTKLRPTSIAHLITRKGKASSWSSYDLGVNGEMHIFHYNTLMAIADKHELVQVSEGWGSMSDKCGMAKLRREATLQGLEFRKEIRG
jgi:hypothetical protein